MEILVSHRIKFGVLPGRFLPFGQRLQGGFGGSDKKCAVSGYRPMPRHLYIANRDLQQLL
jgi:hypothetical protein